MGNNALLPSLRVLMVRSGLGLNVFVRQAKSGMGNNALLPLRIKCFRLRSLSFRRS